MDVRKLKAAMVARGIGVDELATLHRCLHTIADNAARILTQTN